MKDIKKQFYIVVFSVIVTGLAAIASQNVLFLQIYSAIEVLFFAAIAAYGRNSDIIAVKQDDK